MKGKQHLFVIITIGFFYGKTKHDFNKLLLSLKRHFFIVKISAGTNNVLFGLI